MEDENMNNQELMADEKASLSACSGEGLRAPHHNG